MEGQFHLAAKITSVWIKRGNPCVFLAKFLCMRFKDVLCLCCGCWLMLGTSLWGQDHLQGYPTVSENRFKVVTDTSIGGVNGVWLSLNYSLLAPRGEQLTDDLSNGAWNLTVIDAPTGVMLLTQRKYNSLNVGEGSETNTHFVPFSALPYSAGPAELKLRLTLTGGSNKTLYDNQADTVYSIEMPEMIPVRVEFGPFKVKPNNYKGRRWDRPFIFGNGIPEFLWQLRVGQEVLFESDYVESDDYYLTDQVDFLWEPGTSVKIQVEDEDDIKRDFAGEIRIFKQEQDLPIDNPKTSFGQVFDANLKVNAVENTRQNRVDTLIVKSAVLGKKYLELNFEVSFSAGGHPDDLACAYVHLLQGGEPKRLIQKGMERREVPGLAPYACPESKATVESFRYLAPLPEVKEGFAFRVDFAVSQHDRVVFLESETYPFELTERTAVAGLGWVWVIVVVFVVGLILGGIGLLAKKKKS